MDRISPERVEAAFAACGNTPVRNQFFEINLDVPNECCGLTAVAIAEKGAAGPALWKPTGYGTTEAIDSIGLDPDYAEGFIRGWDRPAARPTDLEFAHHTQEPYLSGFEDGRASVIHMGLYEEVAC